MSYPTQAISGQAYVPGRLTNEPGAGTTPVIIRTPRRCGHVETVCAVCVAEWLQDWTLMFHRTVGGRRLAAQMEAS